MAADILASLGLEQALLDNGFGRDDKGALFEPDGTPVVLAGAETMRSLHTVIDGERAGSFGAVMKSTGKACGRKIGTALDRRLSALGKASLAALPLEACLAFLERYFALHGWGRLKFDLTEAEQGVVIARLENSHFVDALPHAPELVDPLHAGFFHGFFEHITSQTLACEEISCVRRGPSSGHGAPQCTFVITAPERLAAVVPRIGQEPVEALIARLRV